MRRYKFIIIAIIAFAIIKAAFALAQTEVSVVVPIGETELIPNPTPAPPSRPTGSLCEIGKIYDNTAVDSVACVCPEGYYFKTVEMGWGPCPTAGMSDCVAAKLQCVVNEPRNVPPAESTQVPVPVPIGQCPQNCSCDAHGGVQYCDTTPTSAPVPVETPARQPLSAVTVPAPMPLATSVPIPVMPVRIEATPVYTAITVPQQTAKSCPVGCICEGETTSCPAAETREIIVPVVSFVSAQAVTAVPVRIEVTPNEKVLITSHAVTAVTTEKVIVEGSRLFLGLTESAKPVSILPHEVPAIAMTSENITSISTIELKTNEQKPVYEVEGTREARLLFFIPVSVPIQTEINAIDGKIISVKKPWWSFFTF